ncbi:MAG: NADH:flavin oxidoreductase [Bacteroidales bacterium]
MKRLFEEVSYKGLKLKNRFVRSAAWMKMADEKGNLTPELVKVYEDLAKGGVGMIISGYTYIDKNDQPNPNMSAIYDDSFIPQWSEVTEMAHRYDTKMVLQIVYGGSQTNLDDSKNRVVLAPSAVLNRRTGIMPKEMSHDDIKHVIKKFGDAAVRAKLSGFDGIQIHAAHGYLLSMFLTPYYNRRTDEYGGSIHNRARIIYEVYNEIRSRVGDDYPVLIKLNFDDFMEPGEGVIFEESIEVFKRLDELGIDLVEASATNESANNGQSPARKRITKIENQSYYLPQAKVIASEIKAPVILVGGNRNAHLMQEILDTTPIELFSLARPLLSEPDLINKWRGNLDHKPQCVACNKCWSFTPNSCVFLQ